MTRPAQQAHQRSDNTIHVREYVPNYRRACGACDARPTVECITIHGVRMRIAELCGPCTFGTSQALDPAMWNKLDD